MVLEIHWKEESKGRFLYNWQLVALMDHSIDILSMAK